MSCEHEQFEASVQANRLLDTGRIQVDLEVRCADCGTSLRFLGLPIGVDLNGAAVSADGVEARLAAYPSGETPPDIPKDLPVGFRQVEAPP